MPSLCKILSYKMKMPALTVKPAHIIRTIQTYHGTVYIIKIQLYLILGKRLIKHPVWLFLLVFTPYLQV